MALKQAETDPKKAWIEKALWVQDIVMLHRVDTGDDGTILLQYQTGETCRLTEEALTANYFAFGSDDVFKPMFRPIRARCFDDATEIATVEGVLHVPRGDAVVEHSNGKIEVMPRQRFNLRYRIVGHAAPVAPVAPFVPGAV